MNCRGAVLMMSLLLILTAASIGRAEVVLVDKTGAQAVIVVPDEPTDVATYAANELVDHVKQATGVQLDIIEESELGEDESPYRIYVGATQAARQAGVDPDALSAEVAVLRTTDRALYIIGHDEAGDPLDTQHIWAGTLWGVYELLQREMGVRWLWPGPLGTHVPAADRIAIGEWNERFEPRFERRRLKTYHGRNDPRYGHTVEGRKAYIDAERVFLRRHQIGQSKPEAFYYTRHSFLNWWDEYGEEHPEWFQLRQDGERGPADGRSGHTSMCVSNPELHAEIVRRFAARLKENADAPPVLSVGENDVHVMCLCESCRAWDDPQPTKQELAELPRYAQGMYHPVNAGARYARYWKSVYELAKQVDPDVIVTAFIYSTYFPAPQQDIELNRNIVLSFAPYAPRGPEMPGQRSFWFPRYEDEQQWLKRQWDGWRETGATLIYRPNYTLDGYAMPHNYMHQLAEVFQYYAAHGAAGTSFDSLVGQWSTQGPTLYLLARLHARPEADVERLLDEYYSAFGPAADHVREYFAYWEKHTLELRHREDAVLKRYGTRRLHTYPSFAHEFFPRESFEPAEAILDRAAAVARREGNELHQQRVAYLRDGLKHARLCVEVAARFADDSATTTERREALEALATFRHGVEDRFIANYHWINRQERESWGGKPGFFDRK